MNDQQIQEHLDFLKTLNPGITAAQLAAVEQQLRALAPSPAPDAPSGTGQQG